MDTFYLEILSPQRVFYRGECSSVNLPISDGMIGIMAHHTPLTAAIEDGEVTFVKPDGERVTCAVMRGMADVTDNKVRVLCESALYPYEIDEEAEKREIEEAKAALKSQQSLKDYKLWQLSFNKAVNRLRVKSKERDNINI